MPFTADAIAAQHVQKRLKNLYQLVQDIEKRRQHSENGVMAINKLQTSQEDPDTNHYQVRCDYHHSLVCFFIGFLFLE